MTMLNDQFNVSPLLTSRTHQSDSRDKLSSAAVESASSGRLFWCFVIATGTAMGGGVYHTFRDRISDYALKSEGHIVAVAESTKRLTVANPVEKARFAFKIRNITGEPVTVLGAETHCGCATVTDLPTTIPPDESVLLELVVAAGGQNVGATFVQEATLHFDKPSPKVVLRAESVITGVQRDP